MKLRVLIADDEPLARERLRKFLNEESGVEIVGECANGSEALGAIRAQLPDAVFLDVRMPGLDGFEVIAALDPQKLPAIIFVTAHDQFAIRAFEANAVDYLLKPFGAERLRAALQRIRDRRAREGRGKSDSSSVLSQMMAALRQTTERLERLSIRSNGRIVIVKTADVDWIAAADNYVELHVGGVSHILRIPISTLADQLPRQFVRISRSALVNLTRIKEIHPKSHGDCLVVLQDGVRLNGTRNYRRHLESLLG